MRLLCQPLVIVMGCCLLAPSVTAADHGRFAIQGEFLPASLSEVRQTSQYGASRADAALGIRYMVAKKIGLEFAFGFSAAEGVDMDTLSHTEATPAGLNLLLFPGVAIEILQRKNSTLALNLKPWLSIEKWYAYTWMPLAPSGTKFETYTVAVPGVYLGLEPAYFMGEHFSFYAAFGVSIALLPSTRYIDTSDPTYDFEKGVFPLKDNDNSRTVFDTDRLGIGVRYFF